MSEPTPSGSLAPLGIVAALLLLLGAGAYVAMTSPGTAPAPTPGPAVQPSPGPAAAAVTRTVEAPESVERSSEESRPKGPAQPAPEVPAAAVLDMATSANVVPDRHEAEVLEILGGLIPKMQACAAEWVSRNPKLDGRAFFVFEIDDEGLPVDLTLRFKRIRDDDLDACFTTVLGGARFPRHDPPAKVFWPVVVGGNAVVAPLDQGDAL